jgi:hypothetical protein
MAGCNYYSLKVDDYTAPTIATLKTLWNVLDNFHEEKRHSPRIKCIMHCTAGLGRTGVMILSYIMYRKFKTDRQNATRELLSIRNSIDDFERNNEALNPDVNNHGLITTHARFYERFIHAPNIMQYSFNEIRKYSPDSFEEITGEMTHSSRLMILFENRIKNITNAIIDGIAP